MINNLNPYNFHRNQNYSANFNTAANQFANQYLAATCDSSHDHLNSHNYQESPDLIITEENTSGQTDPTIPTFPTTAAETTTCQDSFKKSYKTMVVADNVNNNENINNHENKVSNQENIESLKNKENNNNSLKTETVDKDIVVKNWTFFLKRTLDQYICQ